jgi:hypothetical protein
MRIKIEAQLLRRIAKYFSTLNIEEKEESYNPATHAQQYEGGTSPSDAKAKKKRRKKNKAARKARRQNRK